MRLVIGIDPGLLGAVAALRQDGKLGTIDMPRTRVIRNNKLRYDIDGIRLTDTLSRLRANYDDAYVFLESVWARQEESPSASFHFGKGYGLIQGILIAVGFRPFVTVPASRWKKAMDVPKGKTAARARATEIFPASAARWARVKDDGRADAAMIAAYGEREIMSKQELAGPSQLGLDPEPNRA